MIELNFFIPEWLNLYAINPSGQYPSIESKMALAIDLSYQNTLQNTGGPFGACIFDRKTDQLISLGVNLVVSNQSCILHAEMVAIMIAQKKLHTYNLGLTADQDYVLVTSSEPCAMCMGAIVWSGVRQVIYGASDEDVRDIGFDEGPKASNWVSEFQMRGISVIPHIQKADAKRILTLYKNDQKIVYNGRN